MNKILTPLNDAFILEPKVFGDERGFFMESYNATTFNQAANAQVSFVQDNHSRSKLGVLRGLHYQYPNPQGKLVRVCLGEIYDVIVDLRQSSSTFGQWFSVYLSAENKKQLWVPEGFAHGFMTTSDYAELLYKTSYYYAPNNEHCLLWNDPNINIQWPKINAEILLSDKDKKGLNFATTLKFN